MKNVVTSNHFKEPGLNGFFGWLGRAVKAVASAAVKYVIPGNGYGLWDAVKDFTDGDGSFGGVGGVGTTNVNFHGLVVRFFPQNRGTMSGETNLALNDLPLSRLDEFYLDNWMNHYFLPYYENIMAKFKNYSINKPTSDILIQFINDTYLLFAYIEKYKDYALINGEEGLTSDAVKTRISFIEIHVKLLQEQLDNFLTKSNSVLTYKSYSTTLKTNKFSALNLSVPPTFNIITKEISTFNGQEVKYTEIYENGNTKTLEAGVNEPPIIKQQPKEKGIKNGTKALLGIGIGVLLSLFSIEKTEKP